MGLHIQDSAFSFDNALPITGNVVRADLLRLAVRANNPANLLDISLWDNTLTAGPNVKYNAHGLIANRKSGEYVESGYLEQDDSFTILAAFRYKQTLYQGAGRVSNYIGGSFSGSAVAGGGVGLVIYFNGIDATHYSVFARLAMRVKNRETSEYSSRYLNVTLAENVDVSVIGTYSDWQYAAATFDALTGQQTIYNLVTGQKTENTIDLETYAVDAVSRGLILDSQSIPLRHRIGNGMQQTGVDSEVNIPAYMFWGGTLSEQEVYRQFAYDRPWLQEVRGVWYP